MGRSLGVGLQATREHVIVVQRCVVKKSKSGKFKQKVQFLGLKCSQFCRTLKLEFQIFLDLYTYIKKGAKYFLFTKLSSCLKLYGLNTLLCWVCTEVVAENAGGKHKVVLTILLWSCLVISIFMGFWFEPRFNHIFPFLQNDGFTFL